ncbi:MAG TPA: FecR family protein [Puia sp.]|nr:FecR family protein [Puia sp.]
MPTEEYNSLEDLVFSRSFRNWVLLDDTPEAEFWTNWAAHNPERGELINQARAVIHALHLNPRPLSADAVNTEVEKVLQKLRDGHHNPVREIPFQPAILGRRIARNWLVAAAIATIAIGAWSLRTLLHHPQESFYPSFIAANPAKQIRQQSADTGATRLLTLSDGSIVRLTRGSKLSWPEGLLNTDHGNPDRRRTVYLEGEASFDIAHSAQVPFYVYTRSVVTKVLGTSFTINTAAGTKTIISVTTGKLSVYHKPDLSAGAILTPNQQISYDPNTDRLEKTIIADPRPLAGPDTTAPRPGPTPAAAVFHYLQNSYGIPIVFDEDAVSHCRLSVTMGNEPFFEKLNIVCKAIGASYEAIDGNIVITAKPACPHQGDTGRSSSGDTGRSSSGNE